MMVTVSIDAFHQDSVKGEARVANLVTSMRHQNARTSLALTWPESDRGSHETMEAKSGGVWQEMRVNRQHASHDRSQKCLYISQ